MSEGNNPASSKTLQEQTGTTAVEQQWPVEKTAGYVVGVDIGGTNLRLALADMSGNIAAKWFASTVGMREPEKVIRLILDGVKNMLSQCQAASSALRSIAIGVPGVTDVENGIVVATSYLMGWQNVPLRALVEKELNIPVVVDNDVNFAAMGESSDRHRNWCTRLRLPRDRNRDRGRYISRRTALSRKLLGRRRNRLHAGAGNNGGRRKAPAIRGRWRA